MRQYWRTPAFYILSGEAAKEFSMKNIFKIAGVVALVAAIAFSMAACDDDSDGGSGGGGNSGGAFVLNDIPASYNGKYALVLFTITSSKEDVSQEGIVGCQSVNESTAIVSLSQIANGRVSMPVWTADEESQHIVKYFGNDPCEFCEVYIYNTSTTPYMDKSGVIAGIDFPKWLFVFKNGGATVSANAGTIITP